MAYISDQNLQDDDNQQNNNQQQNDPTQPPPINGPASGGSTVFTGGDTGSTGNTTSPTTGNDTTKTGSFANLNQYLDANQPQSMQMAANVGNFVVDKGNEASNQLNTQTQNFNNQVNQNTVNLDQDLLDRAATDSTNFVTNQQDVDRFTKMRDAEYKGPESFETFEGYEPLKQNVTNAVNLASSVESDSGIRDILNSINTGRNYTQGANSLDRMLLTQDANAFNILRDAVQPVKGLTDQLNTAAGEGNTLVAAAKATNAETQKAVADRFAQEFSTFEKAVQAKMNDAKTMQASNDAIKKALSTRAALTTAQLAALGLSQAQYDSLLKDTGKLEGGVAPLPNEIDVKLARLNQLNATGGFGMPARFFANTGYSDADWAAIMSGDLSKIQMVDKINRVDPYNTGAWTSAATNIKTGEINPNYVNAAGYGYDPSKTIARDYSGYGYGGNFGDLSRYLQIDNTPIDVNTVASADDFARIAALNQLMGTNNNYGLTDASLAGTYQGQPSTFDYNAARNDLNAQLKSADAARRQQENEALAQYGMQVNGSGGSIIGNYIKSELSAGNIIGSGIGYAIGGPIGGFIGGTIGKLFCHAEGTEIIMADGSIKLIEDLEPGDDLFMGGKIIMIAKSYNNDMYDYLGDKISGNHAVLEDDKWVRVKDSKHGKVINNNKETLVFPMITEKHRIVTNNNVLYSDFVEVDIDLGSDELLNERLTQLNG